jgi:hypothetical protein
MKRNLSLDMFLTLGEVIKSFVIFERAVLLRQFFRHFLAESLMAMAHPLTEGCHDDDFKHEVERADNKCIARWRAC